ncbi:SDR family oxidoreductase [Corynebacterium lactis]|uniref:Alcohol dehydrogenase n=1 Tax=Corynebacterium lactis RW2-5 TaxID=1408189 RepID=A0A0K2H286_9CORY|nr:SDR family oxidoreductase [Corynebacterium lactis]ALA68147.1 alcohol dehydrogenase [Corynebacterium lactis RW2-5]
MTSRATQKCIFISGAGRGIGRSTAEKFLARGYTVGVFDISGDEKWAEHHRNAIVGNLDVTDPGQWEAALDQFVRETGRLDVLINNAGILYGTSFEDGSFEQDSTLVDVNVKGVLFGSRAALPHLKTSKGQLVNICSASAIYGTPDMATYSATKFAVRGITEALEVEWEPFGIDVKAVWPLYVATGMLDDVRTDGTDRMGIRLTAEKVADEVVACVDHTQGRITKVHFPAGLQAKALYYASSVGAPFLNRFINAKLTTKRKIRL